MTSAAEAPRRRRVAAHATALAAAGCVLLGAGGPDPEPDAAGIYHVRPGEEIQQALEAAARDPLHKTVRVHAGTYRPSAAGQALIWFNARHDGILLEAEGEVTLTAANPEVADPAAPSFPAVVNHVVFFGDGVGRGTVLRGFRITGANGFVTTADAPRPIEGPPALPGLEKGTFFYSDGGGIKVFGRSYPSLERLQIEANYAAPCGGGISVEHRGFSQGSVLIRDTVLRGNRTQITGSAIDLLPGSSAIVENCLFVGNISNTGPDDLSPKGREYQRLSGSGALTVFEGSRVWVRRSTFTGNWNGVDDKSRGNLYSDSIFWQNTAAGGVLPPPRYELDIDDGSGVRGCLINGSLLDVQRTISPEANVLGAPDPDFDERFVPRAAAYEGIGYRPPAEEPEE